jgi:hypothetical protein
MRALKKGEFRKIRGESYGTPKEIFGFRTARNTGAPLPLARAFLSANARLYDLAPGLEALRFNKKIESVGAQHIIFQQFHFDRRVQRAYVTVHMDHQGRIYLSKNRSVPAHLLPARADFRLSEKQAVEHARRVLPRRRTRPITWIQDTEQMWFPEGARLTPVWRVRIARRKPAEEWIVYADARSGRILSYYDNLAAVRGRARVFDPNPVIAIDGHSTLLTQKWRLRRPPAHAYRMVTLLGLAGNGRLEGRRVTTADTAASQRVRRTNHTYLLDSHVRGFEEVMAYYHIDSAIRWLERLGFRGRRKIFPDPVRVDVNGTRDDNSWYSPSDRRITFGTGHIDDAEDAETILHELGHAIQDAICPDFGQSEEAAAMGEGFGDYFAASFFEQRKPERFRTSVMSWDGLLLGLDQRLEPPCQRRVDNKFTYADFRSHRGEHENGQIWSATLWDIRAGLGRVKADTLIVESHFQLDGFTTFARGARAIIDADANLYGGANADLLRTVFRRRRIGPV